MHIKVFSIRENAEVKNEMRTVFPKTINAAWCTDVLNWPKSSALQY